ncbi:glutamate-1-semialdehyde 2,1-aminomutase [Lacticaseibacillus sp. GG6-2]
MVEFNKSQAAFTQAKGIFPGGVNSPVRAFANVHATPLFIQSGQAQYIRDIDGNRYLDYVLSWGPLILGHADPQVQAALRDALGKGTSYGAPTLLETQLAEQIQKVVPSLEMLRMVSSGTEATMSAIRLARGYTKRDKIVKFIGNYHGHSDSLLVDAGSGVATFAIHEAPGVPKSLAYETLTVPYNDEDAVKALFAAHGQEIACVIVEPIAGNMGTIAAKASFLKTLRQVTADNGALLIFDEVMTGFRAAYHGAQSLYGITPDLTTLGKVVGGGLPVGVFGGRKEIMQHITPAGNVYHAGTLSGNPLAMAGGISTLKQLNAPLYEKMTTKVDQLCAGIQQAADRNGVKAFVHHVGTMWSIFYADRDPQNFADVQRCDMAVFERVFKGLLQHGIYVAPSQYETNFFSGKHTQADVADTIAAFADVYASL